MSRTSEIRRAGGRGGRGGGGRRMQEKIDIRTQEREDQGKVEEDTHAG